MRARMRIYARTRAIHLIIFNYLVVMKYQDTKLNKEQFLSLTTLYPEEFDLILPIFAKLWYKFYKAYTLEGKRRVKMNWYPEKDTPTLPTVEDKLFFILTYYKQHPLQQFHAASFGLSQGKVSLWVKLLTPRLEEALKKLGHLPCRDGSILSDYLKDFGTVKVVTQDVVEQTMPRPVDNDAQEAMYSGKKKVHTYKNKVDCLDDQYVVFLSMTYLGTVHDKKIADEENCQYPSIQLFQDSGFQGYEPENVHVVMPFKKPKNRKLNALQKWFNQYVAQRRIVIEHAIRGIKRFHIVQHPCRLSGYWVRDRIMNICTGIHNLRVRSPLRSYSCERKFQFPHACAHACA